MKLYHVEGSRSCRVLWLLEELGVDYEIEVLPFDRSALDSADYLAISPFGKVPLLVDASVSMFESVAVMSYLMRRFGEGRMDLPEDAAEYAQLIQWMTFGEATLMGPVSQVAHHTALLPEAERHPEIAAAARRAFAHYARGLDELLSKQRYLVDDEFTPADIVVGYTLWAAEKYGALPRDLVALNQYYDRLRARPAFGKSMG